MCIVLIVCTYSAYSTVLHTTVGPLNVYKKNQRDRLCSVYFDLIPKMSNILVLTKICPYDPSTDIYLDLKKVADTNSRCLRSGEFSPNPLVSCY